MVSGWGILGEYLFSITSQVRFFGFMCVLLFVIRQAECGVASVQSIAGWGGEAGVFRAGLMKTGEMEVLGVGE